MDHDQLIREIYKKLIDLGLYPNNIVGWQKQYAPILTKRLEREITYKTISHAMSGRKDRRGPYYQEILNNLYEMLTEEINKPSGRIIHENVA
jgi:hypothetical protein